MVKWKFLPMQTVWDPKNSTLEFFAKFFYMLPIITKNTFN